MKKLLVFTVLSFTAWGANQDVINLSSQIDPVCEVSFDAEPVASNLDITQSQTDLPIGRLNFATNTPGSNWETLAHLDFTDHLTHEVMPSATFSFSNLKLIDHASQVTPSLPMTSFQDWFGGTGHGDFYLSYTGMPALSLVQGTYSTTWYAECEINLLE